MFENLINLFKKKSKSEEDKTNKETAKERLHLVLMQDRANVSADFLELMKQEIIEVIKKYIDVNEELIDVKLTNKMNSDGTTGAPALYANIPIKSIKNETRKISNSDLKSKLKDNKSEKASNIEKTDDKIEKNDNNNSDGNNSIDNNKKTRKEIIKSIEEKVEVIEEKLEIKQDNKEEKEAKDESQKEIKKEIKNDLKEDNKKEETKKEVVEEKTKETQELKNNEEKVEEPKAIFFENITEDNE